MDKVMILILEVIRTYEEYLKSMGSKIKARAKLPIEHKAIVELYNQNEALIEKIAYKEEEIVALSSKLLDKKCIISNLQNDIFKLETTYYNMFKEFIKNIFNYRLKVVHKNDTLKEEL